MFAKTHMSVWKRRAQTNSSKAFPIAGVTCQKERRKEKTCKENKASKKEKNLKEMQVMETEVVWDIRTFSGGNTKER